ncbi:MAG: sulfatase [Bryobacterales bacterium]|nr:sulfatase [Bryobacterales bacterium]
MVTRRSFLGALGAASVAHAQERPNIVFVLMDDVRWDELGFAGHPFARTPNIDRLAREGVMFRNAFATTPLCSPSRASFLTGLYPHNHGITDNTDRSPRTHKLKTFPMALQAAGYDTAFIGKWHMGLDARPRPGFSHWVSFKGQGDYTDPEFNIDGKAEKQTGYATDLLNERAVAFARQKRDRPFLLYVSHKAVHPYLLQAADGSVSGDGRFLPAERHQNLYAGLPVPRRPNAAHPPKGKPALERKIGDLPPLGPDTGTDDETIRNRQRMLAAADDGVGELHKTLSKMGQLDNTIFIFTSDHGYFYGEHGLSVERRLAYEEALRIPLVIRYPKLAKAGSKIDPMVLSIDVAPTLIEIAGATAQGAMDGRSFLPLLRGKTNGWRKSFLIEYYSDRVFPRVLTMGYKAVRTGRWKYIHYLEIPGADELYDLSVDPYEMTNLAADPGAAKALADMKEELRRLLKETGGA